MNPRLFIIASFVSLVLTAGCAQTKEVARTVWGSSTRALEEARTDALSNTYRCGLEDCYAEVLKIVEFEEYTIFINDRKKDIIVVMGVPGSVDTTEVGIFFSSENSIASQRTKVEVSSLSSNAKRIVAETLFAGLEKIFPEA